MTICAPFSTTISDLDLQLMRRCLLVARRAREGGNHPFGAVLTDGKGSVIIEAENSVHTDHDLTAHAELNLLRRAARELRLDLASCTMYASTEPCPMCASASYWAGLSRIVYGLSQEQLNSVVNGSETSTMHLPIRDLLGGCGRSVVIQGPLLESEALDVHLGYWS